MFGMEILDSIISDAINRSAGYNYYMSKKKKSAKDKTVDEPEEKHTSLVKSGRGKGFMCYGDQEVNVPKKDVVPRKTRSLTIAEEIFVGELINSIRIQGPRTRQCRRSQLTIDSQINDVFVDMYAEWGQKLKGYNYYMSKKKKSAKDKTVDEPEEKHTSLVKSGRGKRFMCYGDQEVNVPKKDVVPRKTRSLTIAEEIFVGELINSIRIQGPRTRQCRRSQLTIDSQINDVFVDMYAEWGQKLKEETENETDDSDDSDMDLLDDSPQGDYDAAGFAFEKAVHVKVLIEIKKLLPTHILKAIASYEGGNTKKRQRDVGEPSSKSSRRDKSLVVHVQDNTPAIQPEDSIIDFFKAETSTKTEGNVYLDLRIKSVVRIMVKKKRGYGFLTSIVVKRSDDQEYEFNNADLPRFTLNDVKDMYLLQV
nr:hypothetical protein [Tanacetum cinerariifolium]